ncbi:MAG: hypothetical protein WA476_20690 [Acidobacteriaceae bacterium]
MKSTIRTFVLAAFAAATIASAHSASAQIYSHNTSGDSYLQSGGNVTVNAVIVGQAGNFTIGGQQSFFTSSTKPVTVDCWMSTVAGGSGLPYGLLSIATIPTDGFVTLSFYGWYSVSGSTELYLVCSAPASNGFVLATNGNITAARN